MLLDSNFQNIEKIGQGWNKNKKEDQVWPYYKDILEKVREKRVRSADKVVHIKLMRK
jgi:hypothetical protein